MPIIDAGVKIEDGYDIYEEGKEKGYFCTREDGSFFAGVFLVSDSGKLRPAGTGITLRFYRTSKSDVRIALAPAGADTLVEAESVWNEKGYWSVSYLEEGTYFLLQ